VIVLRGLYVIVDPEHCAGRDARWVTERVSSVGCAALQLRAKGLSDQAHLTLARDLRVLCRRENVPFWLNDRLDLALLVDADGLHLGQDDLPPEEVRKLWGTRPLGLSTHNLSQARAAEARGVDAIGFGPLFSTQSKLNPDPEVGLAGLAEVCGALSLPVIAIGGVKLEHVPALRAAGASTCAVISAVCGAPDPAEVARAFRAAFEG